MGGQCHASAALSPEINRYALCRCLGGPRCRSGRVRKMSPTEIRSPDRPARSLVAIPTMPARISALVQKRKSEVVNLLPCNGFENKLG